MGEERIPVSRPDLTEAEIAEVLSVLRTPTLSQGPKLAEFEERMAAHLGTRHAVAVSSGTAGLHLAVRAAGLEEGEEVLTTPFSFVASANVLMMERAVPVFVDIEEGTLNLSPQGVEESIERSYRRSSARLVNRETGRRLAGLLPVDVFGHPIDIDGFQDLAERHRLWLVEDACEAMGSEVLSRDAGGWVPVGRRADLSVFAFYPNKQMTTGEGGLIATDDETLARRVRRERNQGRAEGAAWLDHLTLGYNYRMDELSAALGVAQLRRFEELRRKRRDVAARYGAALAALPAVRPPRAEPWARVNWFVYVVRLPREVARAALVEFLTRRGIETRIYFPPIHLQPFYRDRLGYGRGAFPLCEAAGDASLALPFFNDLTEVQIAAVVQALSEGVESCVAVRP